MVYTEGMSYNLYLLKCEICQMESFLLSRLYCPKETPYIVYSKINALLIGESRDILCSDVTKRHTKQTKQRKKIKQLACFNFVGSYYYKQTLLTRTLTSKYFLFVLKLVLLIHTFQILYVSRKKNKYTINASKSSVLHVLILFSKIDPSRIQNETRSQ